MAFLTKDDLKNSIQGVHLDAITKTDDLQIDVAISKAVQEAKGYLNSRYDTDAIFTATGSDRNPVVLMYCVDLAIYHLHTLIGSNKLPETRKDRYKEAKNWFELVMEGKINDPDLPLVETEDKDYVKSGSNPKRTNHI